MSGVGDRGLDMSVGWDNTSKRHNYTTRRSLGFPGKRIYFIKIGQVGDLNRDLEAGVFASGEGEEYTTAKQVWAVQVLWSRK